MLRVRTSGQLQFGTETLPLSKALAGELVGLLELDDDCWLVSFAGLELGIFPRQ